MKNLLEYIITNIVKHPEDLEITETTSDDSSRKICTYEIKLNPSDVSLVIGKEGKTIKSIHSILRIAAIKKGVFVDIRVKKE